ncbi:hypothetical protein WJX77_003847 [Trebouxia sp. C0004]
MLQCPFCLKPFKNYHSLQRHANRLSKTAADEGQHQSTRGQFKTVSLYQQQLATALVLCLISVGQSDGSKEAALSVLNQLLRIEHDSLALDTDGQGSQCMGCGIAVYICAWKGKADPRLRRNMWCMMCKDAESTELVRIVSKDNVVKAIKLLTDTTILHMPRSRSEVGQWLGMTSPSIAELDCYLPAMSCKAVLTGFTSDLCTWAKSEDAGLSAEQRQPDKIVTAVQRMLSSSYLAFTVRMDTAFTGEAKQLISMRLQTAHSEWWGEHTARFIDMHRTTLCLIGMAGTRTAPHADWADAKNFAIAIGRKAENLQDCVKIAWDILVPEHMAAYMATWQHVFACVTKSNAPDYMAAMGVLWVAAQKL